MMREKVMEILTDIDEEIVNYNGTNLFDAGYLDSLIVVNLVVELEEAFDVEIDAEYVVEENFCTVDAIVALLERVIQK